MSGIVVLAKIIDCFLNIIIFVFWQVWNLKKIFASILQVIFKCDGETNNLWKDDTNDCAVMHLSDETA